MSEDTETTQADVIGKRLTVLGILGAVVTGVIWLAQKNTHDNAVGLFVEQDPFNATPYQIAMAVAVAVFVIGAVIQGSTKS